MKLLLALTTLWSVSAMAQTDASTCSSSLIYQPFQSCRHESHGTDPSMPGSTSSVDRWTDIADRGGAGQGERSCDAMVVGLNRQASGTGVSYELPNPTPVSERSEKNKKGEVHYWRLCRMTVTHPGYAMKQSAVCGVDPMSWFLVGNQSVNEIPGRVSCLSCDNYGQQANAVVSCLKRHIEQVINPKKVELRSSDIDAVKAKIEWIKKRNSFAPVPNLNDETIGLFLEFSEKN